MTEAEITAILDKLVASIKRVDSVFDQLGHLVGRNPESPMFNACYGMAGDYIKSVSALIGDEYNWVEWYVWDNDCGARGHEAKAPGMPALIPIRTTADLARMIVAGMV